MTDTNKPAPKIDSRIEKLESLDDIKVLRGALAAAGILFASALPMFVFGWLVSAIARNLRADEALQHEAVYLVIVLWKGGVGTLPPLMLLIVLFACLFILAAVLYRYGKARRGDMEKAKAFVQKLLLPMYASASSFACGCIVNGSNFGALFEAGSWLLFFAVLPILTLVAIGYAEAGKPTKVRQLP